MKRMSGFTTMELMTVVAIIGILAAIATPNLISWRSDHLLKGSARVLQATINGARIKAVKNNAIAQVTFNVGANQINTILNNRATGVQKTITTKFNPGVQITGSTFADAGFQFNGRGFPLNLNDTSFAFGTITISNNKGTALQVAMNTTGLTEIF